MSCNKLAARPHHRQTDQQHITLQYITLHQYTLHWQSDQQHNTSQHITTHHTMLHQYTLHRQTDQHWQTDSRRQTNSYLLQSEIYQFRLYHEKGILIKIWKHCFRFNPGIPSGPDFSPKLRNSSSFGDVGDVCRSFTHYCVWKVLTYLLKSWNLFLWKFEICFLKKSDYIWLVGDVEDVCRSLTHYCVWKVCFGQLWILRYMEKANSHSLRISRQLN